MHLFYILDLTPQKVKDVTFQSGCSSLYLKKKKKKKKKKVQLCKILPHEASKGLDLVGMLNSLVTKMRRCKLLFEKPVSPTRLAPIEHLSLNLFL